VNEWLTAQWNRLRRKVDHLVVALLAILLGIMFLLYWMEQQLPEPQVPPLPPIKIPTPILDATSVSAAFTHPKSLREVPQFRGLMDFNMFDARSVGVRTDLEARLDKQYEKAQEAFLRNDLATAEKICNDIIAQMPSHQKTVELLKMISTKKRESEKEPTKVP